MEVCDVRRRDQNQAGEREAYGRISRFYSSSSSSIPAILNNQEDVPKSTYSKYNAQSTLVSNTE